MFVDALTPTVESNVEREPPTLDDVPACLERNLSFFDGLPDSASDERGAAAGGSCRVRRLLAARLQEKGAADDALLAGESQEGDTLLGEGVSGAEALWRTPVDKYFEAAICREVNHIARSLARHCMD